MKRVATKNAGGLCCLLLAVALALVCVAPSSVSAAASDADPIIDSSRVTPLLGWSTQHEYFAREASTLLQTVTDLPSALAGLVESLASSNAAAAASSPLVDQTAAAAKKHPLPGALLVVLGTETRTRDLRRANALLRSLFDGAAGSLTVPHVVHAPGAGVAPEDVRAAIAARLPASRSDLLRQIHKLSDAAALLAHDDDDDDVDAPCVVVARTEVAGHLAGTPEGAAEELRQVAAAHNAAAAAARGGRLVTLFAAAPRGSAAVQQQQEQQQQQQKQQRRRLQQQQQQSYTVCDARCRVQVKWLEGMLALLLLVVATLLGLACLGMLDTPTRFQTAKEAGRAE